MNKQFKKNEIEIILKLMKDVDFRPDNQVNYVITRNERKLKNELKEIHEDIESKDTPEERLKTKMIANSFYYDVNLYTLKQFPSRDRLKIKEAFLLQLIAENPKEFELDATIKNDRSDYFRATGIVDAIQDIELDKDVALKLAFNILQFMEEARKLNETDIAQKQVQLSIDQQLMLFRHYKKTKDGNLEMDNNQPVVKDEEKAEKDMEAFNKKHKEDFKSFNEWLNKEEVDFSFASITLDDLPEDITKKQMEVLVQFIKED